MCQKEIFLDEEPILCCNGKDCGCLGKSIEPILCKDCEIKFWADYYSKTNPQRKTF